MSEKRTGHRVAVLPAEDLLVEVRIGGLPVASSRRPVLVYETGMPVRYYLPPQDVDLSLFSGTATETSCPFKGTASYWAFHGGAPAASAEGPGTEVAWSYQRPLDSVAAIGGHLAFYDDRAEITVTGEPPVPAGRD
ncbi:DUF427 domain-containing protein [Streptomyces sp. NPDC097619]|uniref:DUF427 domain-containing protein n=1 Tax=Streptomyces sp. NPDC097619 TaxID=3157228 RepID=UPI00333158C3